MSTYPERPSASVRPPSVWSVTSRLCVVTPGFYQMCFSNFHNHFGNMQVFLSFGVYYHGIQDPAKQKEEEKKKKEEVSRDLNNTLSIIQVHPQQVWWVCPPNTTQLSLTLGEMSDGTYLFSISAVIMAELAVAGSVAQGVSDSGDMAAGP